MKNKFLLLGATALLSMGTIAAKADTPTGKVTIRPSVDIVTPLAASVKQELYLGAIINPQENQTIIIDPTGFYAQGTETLVNVYYDKDTYSPHVGKIEIEGKTYTNDKDSISYSFPNLINLEQCNGDECLTCGEFVFDKVSFNKGANDVLQIWFGGTFTDIGGTALQPKKCNGNGAVTVFMKPSN